MLRSLSFTPARWVPCHRLGRFAGQAMRTCDTPYVCGRCGGDRSDPIVQNAALIRVQGLLLRARAAADVRAAGR